MFTLQENTDRKLEKKKKRKKEREREREISPYFLVCYYISFTAEYNTPGLERIQIKQV